MSKENLYKNLIIVLIILGAFLRLTVFWVSPVNNSYDDHLEVIKIYIDDSNRPTPSRCWECYQPPLYYYIGAAVFNISESIGFSKLTCWKTVQFINPFLSIILIIIIYQILILLKLTRLSILIILSFIITLPRDILTSSMIGNDYMLVFFSITSFYLFLKSVFALKNGHKFWPWLTLLVITATLGSITKQHGLLILIFPLSIFFLICSRMHRQKLYFVIPILLIGTLLSISDEIWTFSKSGTFFVSNQKYFDYTKNQFPGSLDKIEFLSFRIINLFKEPFISDKTAASFLTELFARTFYDYEWRFISPKIPWANTLGIIGYSLGLLWLFYFGIIVFSSLKRLPKIPVEMDYYSFISKVIPIVLALLFMLVPLMQTIRYPYFSSMKSMFMLPGIILLLLIIGSQIKQGSLSQKLGKFMIGLNLFYGILLVVSIFIYLGISKYYLSGPLWNLP